MFKYLNIKNNVNLTISHCVINFKFISNMIICVTMIYLYNIKIILIYRNIKNATIFFCKV